MDEVLKVLRDPICGKELSYENNNLRAVDGSEYRIVDGIPRFVGSDNYSLDFGDQWNKFPRTQLDSFTGLNVSESRLKRCMRGNLDKICGKKVLEAGSGAGRFTEVLLKWGAIVHSFDYSRAVEANKKNNGISSNLVLVQADIRQIPFEKKSYDFVVCLGVLQHTPNSCESIKSLWEMVSPQGALVFDHYPWKFRFILPPPFGEAISVYRWIALRLPRRMRFNFVKSLTGFFFPVHWEFKDSRFLQRLLRRISPVIFHYPDIALKDYNQYYEWSLLDTHDATTDFYKHRKSARDLIKILEGLGAKEIFISEGGNGYEVFCRK